jgi:hypothetical protein
MSEMTFNSWFCNLPEGRQIVLKEDKWRLSEAAFEAGKSIGEARAISEKKVEAPKPDVVWGNIFNTSHKLYGHMALAFEAWSNTGYPYYTWNGWIIDGANATQVGYYDTKTMVITLK